MSILSTKRIHVKEIPSSWTTCAILEHFGKYGTITKFEKHKHKITNPKYWYCNISFLHLLEAEEAILEQELGFK